MEDGKYGTLTEDSKPAMFFSFQQEPNSNTWLIVRSERDAQEIAWWVATLPAQPRSIIAARDQALEQRIGFQLYSPPVWLP